MSIVVLFLFQAALGWAKTYQYDELNRLTGIIFDNGSSAYYSYDSAGNITNSTTIPVIPLVFGDVNSNGAVDLNDLNILSGFRNQPADQCPECDIDGDGTITVLDMRKLATLCTKPRCIKINCYQFQRRVPHLDVAILFTPSETALKFQYTSENDTEVSFDVYLNGQFVTNVGQIPPGQTSDEIFLPGPVPSEENVIELKNPVCSLEVENCTDGEISFWKGKVCIFP